MSYPIPERAEYVSARYSAGDSVLNQMTVGDYAAGMPRIRVGEFFNLLGRQILWLAPLLALGVIAAWYLTSDFEREYTASGSIMVQLGSEYVYSDPTREGVQSGGAALQITPDHICLLYTSPSPRDA